MPPPPPQHAPPPEVPTTGKRSRCEISSEIQCLTCTFDNEATAQTCAACEAQLSNASHAAYVILFDGAFADAKLKTHRSTKSFVLVKEQEGESSYKLGLSEDRRTTLGAAHDQHALNRRLLESNEASWMMSLFRLVPTGFEPCYLTADGSCGHRLLEAAWGTFANTDVSVYDTTSGGRWRLGRPTEDRKTVHVEDRLLLDDIFAVLQQKDSPAEQTAMYAIVTMVKCDRLNPQGEIMVAKYLKGRRVTFLDKTPEAVREAVAYSTYPIVVFHSLRNMPGAAGGMSEHFELLVRSASA